MRIYIASSWRNEKQPQVVLDLMEAGHQVYDFRNPEKGNNGFRWEAIDLDWEKWTTSEYRDALKNPVAQLGYNLDMRAMKWCDVMIGVQPFGRSASLELGWAVGAGKRTILLLSEGEPELMVKMVGRICLDMEEVIAALHGMKLGGM